MTATTDTFLISWLITGSVGAAGGIASLEVFTKLILYYAHERAWVRVPWGRGVRERVAGGAIEEPALPKISSA